MGGADDWLFSFTRDTGGPDLQTGAVTPPENANGATELALPSGELTLLGLGRSQASYPLDLLAYNCSDASNRKGFSAAQASMQGWHPYIALHCMTFSLQFSSPFQVKSLCPCVGTKAHKQGNVESRLVRLLIVEVATASGTRRLITATDALLSKRKCWPQERTCTVSCRSESANPQQLLRPAFL